MAEKCSSEIPDPSANVCVDQSPEEIEKIEREELANFISELTVKINAKSQLRKENSKCAHPGDEYFSRLDSSLKKNTAFVKKLKQFTAVQLDGLTKDMNSLNLSKYISEICAALAEAKLKMTDVNAVVTLCSMLHQTYVDFDGQFLEAWQKALTIKPGEKISNPSKMRVDLRLFAELVSSGIISGKQGLCLLGNVLTNIISQDKDDHSHFSIILSFCRHCGEEYAGLTPRRILQLAEKYDVTLPKSDFLTPDKQQNLRNLLKDYFNNFCKHLVAEQEELLALTKKIRRIMESKGEISNGKKAKCELKQANFDKMLSSAQTLSELLNEPLPEMASDSEIGKAGTVPEDTSLDNLDPWGDEETKAFYTDLPDLRQFLPNFSAPKQDLEPIEEPIEMTEEALDVDIDADVDCDDPPSTASDPTNETESQPDDTGNASAEPVLPDKIGSVLMEVGRMSGVGQNMKQQFEQFLANLYNCVNKELIDSAAIEFLLNFNTKNNRKKLTKYIFGVQRTRLDLLPFLARFVAIINLVNTDVATDLSIMLRKELRWHMRKKNQLNIESKIKIVRFIGEIVKFGLCKKFDGLACLKMLLRDFRHHQIEMACAFIEVAGVYLYNCRDSRPLTNVFLDQMIRMKTNTALDSRHAAQVESVYYLVKPPDSVNVEKKLRPPIHEYIRHLIFEELCKQNVDKCIKMMRRINWDDPEISGYAIKCLSKAYLLRFPLIRFLADLVSGLSPYQEQAVTMVIDNVFEDIRAGLEIHSPKLAQRRIAMAKYLGELYNYKLIESTNVLNTLYSIISLGVSTEEGVISPLDPPDSLFRLKLACVLLETTGQYFTSVASRKKLDYFFVFFQHYYWFKKSNPIFSKEDTTDLFPILVDHMYRECLAMRPKLTIYKSLEEAKEGVQNLKAELYPHLVDQQGNQDGAGDGSVRGNELNTIREDSEYEDELSDRSYGSDEEKERRRTETEVIEEQPPLENPNQNWMENKYVAQNSEKSKEDLEFEQMFEKMTADSFQERLKDPIKPNAKDIPVPMMAKNIKKSYEQIHGTGNSSNNNEIKDGSVPFVLMVRGGKGKQQFKTFVAPSDSHLAINLKLQEQKIREENAKVKRLTLNITERIEEEDYQESLLQSQKGQSQSYYQRQNRPKFKHQKGAPDADLIFN